METIKTQLHMDGTTECPFCKAEHGGRWINNAVQDSDINAPRFNFYRCIACKKQWKSAGPGW